MSLEEQRRSRLAALDSRWSAVAGTVALTALFNKLNDVTSSVDSLDNQIADVRQKGYRFGAGWEDRAAKLQQRWPQQRNEARQLLEQEKSMLQRTANSVQNQLNRARSNYGLMDTAESSLQRLERDISNVESRLYNLFNDIEDEAYALECEIEQADFLIDSLNSASFELQPNEEGVAVCKAQWVSDKEEPEGLLYLTDQRIIFERHEEVATKKFLFVTTEKELIQELMWASPVGAITELEAEDKKTFLFAHQELLILSFAERTRELPGDVTLKLQDATNEEWTALIRQVKTGQVEAERLGVAQQGEQAAAQVTEGKEIPTKCPSCGAKLPPVYKGMTSVECNYCGTVISL
ncbi:MAG: hypothetical protein JW981_02075 [Anaerolineae bacterium]|nr:hypothetical protein [Anaerolineae bacterium]